MASMKDIGSDEDVDDGLDPEDDDLLVSASFVAINHVWKSTVSSASSVTWLVLVE